MNAMMGSKGARWAVLTVLGVTLLLGLGGPLNRAEAAATRNVGELTAQWWQWAVSIPADSNPLFDETGENAAVGQPFKGNKVFFLAGVFNETGTATRSITVPKGTAFFFPLLNYFTFDETNPGRKVSELYAEAAGAIDLVDYVYVTLDDNDLTEFAQRVASPPFGIKVPADNIVGVAKGNYSPAVSDGYWFYLPPLDPGTYTLKFGGFVSAFDFQLDLTYTITVE